MLTGIVICFIVGYLTIVLEHPLKLDKSVPALLMGAFCWAFISVGHLDVIGQAHTVAPLDEVLLHHLGKIAEIIIFLLGAMTIVELVDLHRGFSVITDRIKTTDKLKMLWMVSWIGFFLSTVLDNLTTTIVMVSLLRKLIPDKSQRIWFVCMIIVAANAGGAWSPIGDVTTTMLWIGKKVSTEGLIIRLVIPSLLCLLVPLLIAGFLPQYRGKIEAEKGNEDITAKRKQKKLLSSTTMFILGIGGLIFVPIFKTITHLPPYIGMMVALGVVWLVSEYIHPEEDFSEERKHLYTARHALSRIEITSIIFFLGILLAVAALESVMVVHNGHQMGMLMSLSEHLRAAIPNQDIVITILGFLSAVIDNVPLVAAAMGMYPMDAFPMDDKLWHFIAYSAGTGGSMLIIGSAAGVAAMGMEHIDFIWYLRKFAWLAMAGFLAGIFAYVLMQPLF